MNETNVNKIPVPAPAPVSPSKITKNTDLEFTIDDILNQINNADEDGNSPCYILASLELMTNVTDDMTLADVPEENKQLVDDMEIKECSVDTYSLDGKTVNVVLTFKSVKDAYLLELKNMLDRYRLMQDEITSNGTDSKGKIPVFSMSFMPKNLGGHGLMQAFFPIAYFRTLSDAGVNCTMHMIFNIDDISFVKVDLDEDTMSEIQADVMRELEDGSGGSLFE